MARRRFTGIRSLFATLACLLLAVVVLFQKSTTREKGEGALNYDLMLAKCGELCEIGAGVFVESTFFPQRTVPVDCKAIFSDEVFSLNGHGQSSAPQNIPQQFAADYTLNYQIPVKEYYFNQQYHSSDAAEPVWSRELIDDWVSLATNDQLVGNYGITETNHLRSALKSASGIRGGRVLIIGSEVPWVEATVLSLGAKSLITLEYGKILSQHPAVQTMTPAEFKQSFEAGTIGLFDAIVTFSSVEHSGLGRYGDALNPWGDVLEIARAHCVCRPGGSLTIAVMTKDGADALEFNAHRVYGDLRWPYLASNWEQTYREPDGEQRVHVFTKRD